MKPLSELREEILKLASKCDRIENKETAYWRAFANGLRISTGLLQAWLREADAFLEPGKIVAVFPSENERSMDVSKLVSRIRRELLGTTRQEGEK